MSDRVVPHGPESISMEPMSAMPDKPKSNGHSDADQLTEFHEERIQRLEESQAEVAVQVAASSVKIDYLTGAVESGLARLEQKMDAMAKVSDEVEKVGARVEKLESTELVRKERWSTLKKASLGLGVGAIAFLIERLLAHWLF